MTSLGSNSQTLDSYNDHIDEYIAGTPQVVSGEVETWINRTLDGVPIQARILEIGSAFGRDADYIESLGYVVERTDAAKGFVDLLNGKGNKARQFNAITDELSEQSYDLVFADAVFLHFNREELASVLRKILIALSEQGRLSFRLKRGEGEGWSDEKVGAPRYFCYWDEASIKSLLEETGYASIQIQRTENKKWLNIIADK